MGNQLTFSSLHVARAQRAPNGYPEAHTITVDSAGNLYGGDDNQYGRT
jgi:hypothetical protein